jgi:hypothetical protein
MFGCKKDKVIEERERVHKKTACYSILFSEVLNQGECDGRGMCQALRRERSSGSFWNRWENILKLILEEYSMKLGTNLTASGYGPMIDFCGHVNEPWGSIITGNATLDLPIYRYNGL